MENLKKYLLEKAIANNICDEWAGKIAKAKTPDELMQMYVTGIDFCLSNSFPDNTDLKNLLGDYINKYGVYVDDQVTLPDSPFLVLLGVCNADVSYSGFSVSQLFIRHGSVVKVRAAHHAFLVIDCFDDSLTDIEVADDAKVLVNVYGKARISTSKVGKGIIKIVNKLKETY